MEAINQDEQLSRTRAIFETGVVHDKDFECFRNMNMESPLILDVGANRGQSIASFKNIFLDAKITSFEANPQFFEILDKVQEWYSEVSVHKLGLGSRTGHLEFYLPKVDGKYILEEGSIRRDNFEKPWVVERLNSYGENLEFVTFDVEIVEADSFLRGSHFDIVKIDIEGAEYDALSKMTQLIEKCYPVFLIENSDFENVTHFLSSYGYQCFQYSSKKNFLKPIHSACTNCFYAHPSNPLGLDAIW